jgi:VWA N-terminal
MYHQSSHKFSCVLSLQKMDYIMILFDSCLLHQYCWLCDDLAASVLNGVAWSATLDETFRRNFKDDTTLSWQYFASQSGFLRNFPGEAFNFSFVFITLDGILVFASLMS